MADTDTGPGPTAPSPAHATPPAAPEAAGPSQDPGGLADRLGRLRQARGAGTRARGAAGNGLLIAGLALAAGGATYLIASAGERGDDRLRASEVEAFQSAASTGGRITFPEDEPAAPETPPIRVEAPPTPAPAPVEVAARPDDALALEVESLRRALRESEAARERDARTRAEDGEALREELRAAFDERLAVALATSEEAAREAEASAQRAASALATRQAELEAARRQVTDLRGQLATSEADVLAAEQAEQARLDAEARRMEEGEALADLRERQIASPAVIYAEGGVAPSGAGGAGAGASAPSPAAAGTGPRLTASEAYLASAPPLEVAEARRLADPDRTLVQGTVIQAALQTAVSSELPGSVVAVVSEPVMAFSGDAVLVPRGSRLFGSYREGVQAGQRRVLIRWSRILTPDGASMEISSVGGDGLGRSGLSGFVDTRFRERFGGAALVSLIGGAPKAAAAALGDGAGVGLVIDTGDAMGGAASSALDRQLAIAPTIHVPQGAAVTVLVDRDVVVR